MPGKRRIDGFTVQPADNMVRPDSNGTYQRAQKMRAETQNLVDEIKQAISLLRRHL
jgi:hypothetical protein